MTKKQDKILTWLLSKPGYLKKGIQTAYVLYPELVAFSDFEKAFIEAKRRYKENSKITNKPWNDFSKTIKQIPLPNRVIKEINKNFNTIDDKQVTIQPVNILTHTLNKNNTLIIGDTHEPFCKEGYLEFCKKVQIEYNCGTIVHIGDLVDNHAVSYHDHDPDGRSPGDEFKLALDNCDKWYKAFPEVFICIGNHDRLPFRKAFTAGLPKNWLKSYQEMFNSPKGWKWDFVHKLNGVIFQHGTGLSGEMAAINAARENRQSTVIGHLHTVCNTRFLASHKDLIFGMSVGCGIDHSKYAFAYGKENTRKPVLSCGVVINGKMPINIPMFL
jgi:predicted phosphodiesterase